MPATKFNITQGGRERVPRTSTFLAGCFATDPVITWLLHSMPEEKRLAYLPKYFTALLTAGAMNDATFTEINDFQSCMVMMHPGKKVDNPWTMIPAGILRLLWDIGFGPCWRMLFEFGPTTDRCKAKGLRGHKRYYYIFFTATQASSRGQGLCSKQIKHWQEIASRDKVPIWLEATTPRSMKVYQKCGFELLEEVRLGKGKVGPDGLGLGRERGLVKGKDELEGVPIWAMIWWPEETKLTKK